MEPKSTQKHRSQTNDAASLKILSNSQPMRKKFRRQPHRSQIKKYGCPI